MPRAHVSDIVKVHAPTLRLIRTADVRFLRGLWHKLRSLKAGQTIMEPAGDRDIRLVNAWLKNGAPADLTVDKTTMGQAPEGHLFRVDMKAKQIEQLESPEGPGFYLLKRGEA